MDPADQRLLQVLALGIPLVPRPYREIGSRIGISEDEVISRIRDMKAAGIIRRIRSRVNQRLVGIGANALVAWMAGRDPERYGTTLASFSGVTHCYERRPVPGRWEYTLYTVHHGWSRDDVIREVSAIAEQTGLCDYLILFSTEEFKRIPHTRPEDIMEHV